MKYPKVCHYVPEPQPVSCDRTIACHYYPGWKKGKSGLHNGFDDLRTYPERTPLLGYYDEANPEVTDWEIKWAVEHGINCFIYCWYRYQSNLGLPVTREGLRLSYALHDGLFHARYQSMMKFAIMFECQSSRWGIADGPEDFLNHVLPFWVENYFRRENYQKMPDGKIIVFVYAFRDFIKALGGPERCAETLEKAREIMRREGFAGLHFSGMHNEPLDSLPLFQSAGFESAFQYTWPVHDGMLTGEQYEAYLKTFKLPSDIVIDWQLKRIRERVEKFPDYFMFTNSVMRDSHPWYDLPFFNKESIRRLMQWHLQPEEWRSLLTQTKTMLDTLPTGSIGRSLYVIDNWNEWSEGHFIAPSAGYGFRYLQAVREVFTECDNLPDYRTPAALGLGPYDYDYDK